MLEKNITKKKFDLSLSRGVQSWNYRFGKNYVDEKFCKQKYEWKIQRFDKYKPKLFVFNTQVKTKDTKFLQYIYDFSTRLVVSQKISSLVHGWNLGKLYPNQYLRFSRWHISNLHFFHILRFSTSFQSNIGNDNLFLSRCRTYPWISLFRSSKVCTNISMTFRQM